MIINITKDGIYMFLVYLIIKLKNQKSQSLNFILLHLFNLKIL